MNFRSFSNDFNGGCGTRIHITNDLEDQINVGPTKFRNLILNFLVHRNNRLIVLLISCNCIIVHYLWNWSVFANSLALKAYANTLAFNVCALTVCLISIWVEQNTLRKSARFAYSDSTDLRRGEFVSAVLRCKSNGKTLQQYHHHQAKCQRSSYSHVASSNYPQDSAHISVLGLEKYEVLALLASSCLSLVAAISIAIEALVRINRQPIVHEGRLGLGAALGFITHLVTIAVYHDAGLNHIVCRALPCPTLKGVNPILCGNLISFVILCGVHASVHFWTLYAVDTAATFAVIGLTVASMLPLAFHTTAIILQKLSYHMSEQLDKCLRDALMIDGVLEFRNERFWTQSFGKLAGSLEVRINKNADESYVLQKVMKSLSQVVSTLSVQEFREPTATAYFPTVQLPVEYYIDELLHNSFTESREKSVKEEQKVDENKAVDVCLTLEEVLNCPIGTTNSATFKQVRDDHVTIFSNEITSGSHKNYLFRDVPVKNSLLLGSRYDINDLQCPLRIYCQS